MKGRDSLSLLIRSTSKITSIAKWGESALGFYLPYNSISLKSKASDLQKTYLKLATATDDPLLNYHYHLYLKIRLLYGHIIRVSRSQLAIK